MSNELPPTLEEIQRARSDPAPRQKNEYILGHPPGATIVHYQKQISGGATCHLGLTERAKRVREGGLTDVMVLEYEKDGVTPIPGSVKTISGVDGTSVNAFSFYNIAVAEFIMDSGSVYVHAWSNPFTLHSEQKIVRLWQAMGRPPIVQIYTERTPCPTCQNHMLNSFASLENVPLVFYSVSSGFDGGPGKSYLPKGEVLQGFYGPKKAP